MRVYLSVELRRQLEEADDILMLFSRRHWVNADWHSTSSLVGFSVTVGDGNTSTVGVAETSPTNASIFTS